jgi:hypothetical protein
MFPASINPLEMVSVWDDFTNTDTTKWSDVNDGATGTNTADAIAGGQLSVVTAAAANDYHFLVSPAKLFLLANHKPIWFITRLKAGTSAGMWYAGLSSNIAATISTDTTGVVVNTGSMALWYKLPGVLNLGFMTSNATTQTKQATHITTVAAQYYQLGFHWDPGDGTNSIVTAYAYDETAGTKTVATPQVVAVASLAQMGIIFGVKSAGAAETLSLDYIGACQKR